MKSKIRGMIIVLALAIGCVVCSAVQEASSIPNAQENGNILVTPKSGSVPDTLETSSIPVTDRQEDNWQNHLGEIDEDAEQGRYVVQKDETDEAIAVSSEDHKYTVFVRRENRQKLYIYNTEEKKLDQMDVEPDLTTDIMTLEWIGQDKVAVWSHVNPSLGCLDVYDVNRLQNLAEKYCSAYTLADDIDTLVYVEPAPHISSSLGEEKILNMDDEILYQTEKYEIISSIDQNDNGDIAIVVDRMDQYYNIESTDLIILIKNEKKYKVKEEVGLKIREGMEINWINNKQISYSTRKEGVYKTKKIAK